MIVTLNELYRESQKALAGSAMPAGLDSAAAAGTVWLESRGLPGLSSLLGALECWDGDGSAAALDDGPPATGTRCLEAKGRSAAVVAPLVVDLLIAAAGEPGGAARIEVNELGDPWFLLPAAHLYGREGWRIEIEWGEAPLCRAVLGPGCGILLSADQDARPSPGPHRVRLACLRPSVDAALGAKGPDGQGSSEDLEARRQSALRLGLEVEDDPWRRLVSYARRVLVPSSPESRLRGAGVVGTERA